MPDLNVLGTPMEPCGTEPLTGFYRDGCCASGPEDVGMHTICAVMTADFLQAATVAIVGEVTLARLRHAVAAYPSRSEIWLKLLEKYEA